MSSFRRPFWSSVGRPKPWRWGSGVALHVTNQFCLFGRQDTPHGQQHFHFGLFQPRSRLSYLVDLCEHLCFVGRVRFHLEPQGGILFFQVGAQVELRDLLSLGDFPDLLDLIIAEMEFLDEFGILPPFSFPTR